MGITNLMVSRYDKTSHFVKMYAQAVGTLGFLEALTKDDDDGFRGYQS